MVKGNQQNQHKDGKRKPAEKHGKGKNGRHMLKGNQQKHGKGKPADGKG